MLRNLLSNVLTQKEQRLGYRRVLIENPNNPFGGDSFGEPHLLRAVAYKVSETVWIFKMQWPDGRAYYNEMQYGLTTGVRHALPDWCNVRVTNDDPADAIIAARTLPPILERIPVTPPRIVGTGGDQRIYFDATYISEPHIRQNEGERVQNGGREWVSFQVR